MSPTLVSINKRSYNGISGVVAVPLFIPERSDIRGLAERLHAVGMSFHDRMWGWEVTYEPEIDEPDAEVDVPDGKGGFATTLMPLWFPATFTIGESGVWFFSLSWENGFDQPPVEFLDDRNLLERV